jgi:transcriptional regulator with XRE-family HTH domain
LWKTKISPIFKVLLGQAIRRRRREMDISQEELADRAGLNRTYITRVEGGERNLRLETVAQIAKALDITMARLFTEYGVEEE